MISKCEVCTQLWHRSMSRGWPKQKKRGRQVANVTTKTKPYRRRPEEGRGMLLLYKTQLIYLKTGYNATLSPCHQYSLLGSPAPAMILVLHKAVAQWATFC